MKKLLIDAASLSGIEQLHERFAAAFDFPDYYGANLDALYDCLGDVCFDAEIRIINAASLPEKLGEKRAEALRQLLREVSEENKHITIIIEE